MQVPFHLSGRIWARIAAGVFLVLAVLVAATSLRPHRGLSHRPAPSAADPLRAELLRCQALGQAGASDARCLAAWAESRRRFLSFGEPRP